jgi:S1-C subfamily serine protease
VRRAASAAAAVALLAGCGGGGTKTVTAPTASRERTATVEVVKPAGGGSGFSPQAIYKTESPGVVTLIAIETGGASGRVGQALGSGFVVDSSGDIATNAHVVTADAKQVYVEFADGNRLDARIVGTDPDSDVALVKVNPTQLRGPDAKLVPLPLGSTSGLRVGDPVAAIGSPFGKEQSLSVGVVSALDREIESLTAFTISNAIQTDAAINHGNSGGPLLDASGKVVGINSQISSTSGGGEGVGFAVPVETVKRSIDQLRATGSVSHAYLGVSSVSLYPQLAEHLRLRQLTGALIDRVDPGGPAAKAGLRGAESHIAFQGIPAIPVGSDVIVGVDGRALTAGDDLSDLVGTHEPGDTVKLRIVRDGKQRSVAVKLDKRPEQQSGTR